MQIRRRTLLAAGAAGTAAASLEASIQRAAAIQPHRQHGSLRDVEHVVVLMQENRAFDHYFGTMRGVRGFGDPHPALLPNGKSTFHQPNGAGELLPYRPDVDDFGMKFLVDTDHEWKQTHEAFDKGVYDNWVAPKSVNTMVHYERKDIPWHFALADAFTVCDSYHASLLGPTDPNRYFLFTGWDGNDGTGGGPDLWNDESGYDWTTYPELLTRAGVSWKFYQDQGEGLDKAGSWGWTKDPYIGNYGDNSLLYFHQYQDAQPGDPLYEGARRGTSAKTGESLFAQLAADVKANTLPQVSWIAAPEAYSEHGNWPPNYGAWYLSHVLDTLTSNPDVWSRTVLLVMYDENDGFFDHVVPPHPNTPEIPGDSTVPVGIEYYDGGKDVPGNFGLGVRVPLFAVSPWSVGGFVNSEVFDHTSVIRFIEERFGVACPSISPWRRAVCGDLTSCFDFSSSTRRVPALPDAERYAPTDHLKHPDYVPPVPTVQAMPRQEPGVRPARPLGYRFAVDARVTDGLLHATITNRGRLGVHLQLRGTGLSAGPYSYTVGAGDRLEVEVPVAGAYDVAFHGPNGFHRRLAGGAGTTGEVVLREVGRRIRLLLGRPGHGGSSRAGYTVLDTITGRTTTVRAGAMLVLQTHAGWYDLVVTSAQDGWTRTFAGHVEDGRASHSNPLLGRQQA